MKKLHDYCVQSTPMNSLVEHMRSVITKSGGIKNLFGTTKPLPVAAKPENGISGQSQKIRTHIERDSHDDRVFPLDSITVQEIKLQTDSPVEQAILHVGSYADELARSMNALAITIASDIYFRNNAYRPETEEGRGILAHELTHVSQYAQKRMQSHIKKEDLEAEAFRSEIPYIYESDPYMTVRIAGSTYTFKRSQMNRTADEIADYAARELMAEIEYLQGADRLNLLLSIKAMAKREKTW